MDEENKLSFDVDVNLNIEQGLESADKLGGELKSQLEEAVRGGNLEPALDKMLTDMRNFKKDVEKLLKGGASANQSLLELATGEGPQSETAKSALRNLAKVQKEAKRTTEKQMLLSKTSSLGEFTTSERAVVAYLERVERALNPYIAKVTEAIVATNKLKETTASVNGQTVDKSTGEILEPKKPVGRPKKNPAPTPAPAPAPKKASDQVKTLDNGHKIVTTSKGSEVEYDKAGKVVRITNPVPEPKKKGRPAGSTNKPAEPPPTNTMTIDEYNRYTAANAKAPVNSGAKPTQTPKEMAKPNYEGPRVSDLTNRNKPLTAEEYKAYVAAGVDKGILDAFQKTFQGAENLAKPVEPPKEKPTTVQPNPTPKPKRGILQVGAAAPTPEAIGPTVDKSTGEKHIKSPKTVQAGVSPLPNATTPIPIEGRDTTEKIYPKEGRNHPDPRYRNPDAKAKKVPSGRAQGTKGGVDTPLSYSEETEQEVAELRRNIANETRGGLNKETRYDDENIKGTSKVTTAADQAKIASLQKDNDVYKPGALGQERIDELRKQGFVVDTDANGNTVVRPIDPHTGHANGERFRPTDDPRFNELNQLKAKEKLLKKRISEITRSPKGVVRKEFDAEAELTEDDKKDLKALKDEREITAAGLIGPLVTEKHGTSTAETDETRRMLANSPRDKSAKGQKKDTSNLMPMGNDQDRQRDQLMQDEVIAELQNELKDIKTKISKTADSFNQSINEKGTQLRYNKKTGKLEDRFAASVASLSQYKAEMEKTGKVSGTKADGTPNVVYDSKKEKRYKNLLGKINKQVETESGGLSYFDPEFMAPREKEVVTPREQPSAPRLRQQRKPINPDQIRLAREGYEATAAQVRKQLDTGVIDEREYVRQMAILDGLAKKQGYTPPGNHEQVAQQIKREAWARLDALTTPDSQKVPSVTETPKKVDTTSSTPSVSQGLPPAATAAERGYDFGTRSQVIEQSKNAAPKAGEQNKANKYRFLKYTDEDIEKMGGAKLTELVGKEIHPEDKAQLDSIVTSAMKANGYKNFGSLWDNKPKGLSRSEMTLEQLNFEQQRDLDAAKLTIKALRAMDRKRREEEKNVPSVIDVASGKKVPFKDAVARPTTQYKMPIGPTYENRILDEFGAQVIDPKTAEGKQKKRFKTTYEKQQAQQKKQRDQAKREKQRSDSQLKRKAEKDAADLEKNLRKVEELPPLANATVLSNTQEKGLLGLPTLEEAHETELAKSRKYYKETLVPDPRTKTGVTYPIVTEELPLGSGYGRQGPVRPGFRFDAAGREIPDASHPIGQAEIERRKQESQDKKQKQQNSKTLIDYNKRSAKQNAKDFKQQAKDFVADYEQTKKDRQQEDEYDPVTGRGRKSLARRIGDNVGLGFRKGIGQARRLGGFSGEGALGVAGGLTALAGGMAVNKVMQALGDLADAARKTAGSVNDMGGGFNRLRDSGASLNAAKSRAMNSDGVKAIAETVDNLQNRFWGGVTRVGDAINGTVDFFTHIGESDADKKKRLDEKYAANHGPMDLAGDEKVKYDQLARDRKETEQSLQMDRENMERSFFEQKRDYQLQGQKLELNANQKQEDFAQRKKFEYQDYSLSRMKLDEDAAFKSEEKKYQISREFAKKNLDQNLANAERTFQTDEKFKKLDEERTLKLSDTKQQYGLDDKKYTYERDVKRDTEKFGIGRGRELQDFKNNIIDMSLSGASGVEYFQHARDTRIKMQREAEDFQREQQYNKEDYGRSVFTDVRDYNVQRQDTVDRFKQERDLRAEQFGNSKTNQIENFNLSEDETNKKHAVDVEQHYTELRYASLELEQQHAQAIEALNLEMKQWAEDLKIQRQEFENQGTDLEFSQGQTRKQNDLSQMQQKRALDEQEQEYAQQLYDSVGHDPFMRLVQKNPKLGTDLNAYRKRAGLEEINLSPAQTVEEQNNQKNPTSGSFGAGDFGSGKDYDPNSPMNSADWAKAYTGRGPNERGMSFEEWVNAVKAGKAKLPSYDEGGYINRDQIAQIHKGEFIVNPNAPNKSTQMSYASEALAQLNPVPVKAMNSEGSGQTNISFGDVVYNGEGQSDVLPQLQSLFESFKAQVKVIAQTGDEATKKEMLKVMDRALKR